MTRTKHGNQGWLVGDIRDAFWKLSDHILGKHVHGISLPNDAWPGGTSSWSTGEVPLSATGFCVDFLPPFWGHLKQPVLLQGSGGV